MADELSRTQETFCVEYAATGDAAASYRKAFDIQSIPDKQALDYANGLLADPLIKQRIIRLHDTASPREILSRQRVLEELSQIVRTALFPADRLRALDLLGKYYKLFSDKETPNKVFTGENKIQIIYMSPDHKRLTNISPLRKAPRPELVDLVSSAPVLNGAEEEKPASPAASPNYRLLDTDLEKDLDALCG
jgi:hypothetical protein